MFLKILKLHDKSGMYIDEGKKLRAEESIPVGCVPPACQPYIFWWLLLGVSTSRGGGRHLVPTPHPWDTYPPYLRYQSPWDTYPLDNYPSDTYPTGRDLGPDIPTPWKGPGTRDTYPPCEQTQACENITSPQLLLPTVKMIR